MDMSNPLGFGLANLPLISAAETRERESKKRGGAVWCRSP